MKNSRYFPFERNKYFYGKILSVDDFESEQRYNNNKRRAINKMLHGTGVVCGLNVVKIDESFISIENGLALDNGGREILLEAPVMKKLSMFDGFDNDKNASDSSYVYLCVEYEEEEKELVHSIEGNLEGGNSNGKFNKYKESCRLYLDYYDPEEELSEADALYFQTLKLYENNGLIIKQVLPKYAKTGENCNLDIIIEKISLSADISLDFEIGLECLKYHNNEKIRISFDESKVKRSNKYVLSYKITAKDVVDTDGSCTIKPENFSLKIGKNDCKLNEKKTQELKIINNNISEKVIQAYFLKSMDDYVNSIRDKKIYLAKISLIKAGNTYVIDHVENNPFNQRVFNSVLLQGLKKTEKEEIENLKSLCLKSLKDKALISEKSQETCKELPLDIKSGVKKIEVISGKAGEVVFSKEITHGIGLGNVYISLGIDNNSKNEILFGDFNVFEEKMVLPAAKAYKDKGTMIIGIKLLQDIKNQSFNIRWMVYRDAKERTKDVPEITMSIKPDMCDINVLETIYLEAVSTGLSDNRCSWKVKEKFGGEIDSNGKYTAPSIPGIYEIVAKSIENPEIEASTFVIVREDEK